MMNMCKKSLFLRAKATILLFLILPASANLVVAIRASSFVMTMMTEIEACSTEVTQMSNLPIQPSSPSPHPCSNQPGDGQCKPPKIILMMEVERTQVETRECVKETR
ncbi:hypothetical protein POTOM_024297 [Populus tomentosa]|uniref:Uncharacterized protein n=1 Tax=Populus tomentosa TaxID=118781 RepID=A0A8X7ZPK7_POPTO|nr:hypothetical protein POTOM_024297 [Populus tomentosa]